jgi:uncharacterized protein with PIN domain
MLDKHTTQEGEIYICELADEMKRSIDAVTAKLAEMLGGEEELFPKLKVTAVIDEAVTAAVSKNVDRRKIAMTRNCMTCRRPFWSENAGNRICQPCKKEEAQADGYDW